MSAGSFISLLVVTLLGAGCATTLVPAPGAGRVSGLDHAAVAEQAGVRIMVRAQAWRGYPDDLRAVVTPLLVTIDNGGGRPLRLRYGDFTLQSSGGRTFAALPPFEIRGSVAEPLAYGGLGPHGLWLGPYPGPYYPWWPAFGGPLIYDPWYYDRYYPMFRQVWLPTGDMVQKALPEGVVAPGARVWGFVYFEEVEDVERVDFLARLVDGSTGDQLGTISIPFLVD